MPEVLVQPLGPLDGLERELLQELLVELVVLQVLELLEGVEVLGHADLVVAVLCRDDQRGQEVNHGLRVVLRALDVLAAV